MKLKFDPSLAFQHEAIDAVVKLFDGQPFVQTGAETFRSIQIGGLFQTELGLANRLDLADDVLLANTRQIQKRNGIEQIATLQGREFSIEMETGTGKTYVYLRTIFELNKIYGFRKFIIVVPGIAIREGVLKSIDMMKKHFRMLYDKPLFEYFVYDSRRLGKVRQFASGNQIQIMIINIQSFQKDVAGKNLSEMTDDERRKLNVINRENDRLSGRRPIEFIQAANPVIMIDEPQSVDTTEKSRQAIGNLNPMVTLRYSATHRNLYNLLYKLDPIRAYDLRLVKRIEVASVRSEDDFNDAYVKLLKTDNKDGIRARIEFHREGPNGPKAARLWVRQGDDLFVKSGEREIYRNAYIVRSIDCTPGRESVAFSGGQFLRPGQEIGSIDHDVMRAQIHETVEQHLKKERMLRGKGIKILSLFFIDRVANYRIYNEDGTTGLGRFGKWFEEAFRNLTAKPQYKGLVPFDVGQVHNGYFSQDKQGHAKDTRGNTTDDEDAYSLIMRDKERLLDPGEPLRFIFSHSALREGWDNPNIFQICTLNETRSFEKKRQEIGRGLRLPVNRQGERIHDETVNRLTIIANSSYKDFARTLQTEFENDCGIHFGKIEKIAFARLVRTADDGTETEIGQDASARIWAGLVANGYLNDEGEILDKFDPENPHFDLRQADEFSDLKAGIIDGISRRLFKNRIVNARERRGLKLHKEVCPSEDFAALWDTIKHRTRYRVDFSTSELIWKAIDRIKEQEPIQPVHVTMMRVELNMSEAGIDTDTRREEKIIDAAPVQILPDILAFLQKETGLTRHTLVQILKQSGRLDEFKINPQAFMTRIAREIKRALQDLRRVAYDGSFWSAQKIMRGLLAPSNSPRQGPKPLDP